MGEINIQDKTFDKTDFCLTPLQKGEYENCIFKNCNFLSIDVSGFVFSDCVFTSCNLTLIKLDKTAFRDVQFKDCKMLGLRIDSCNPFGLSFSFDNCVLNNCTFHKVKIKNTIFKNSSLQEIDFTACDLTGSQFENCDLARATFDGTVLEKVDLRTSFNYSIDPERNNLKKAKFSAAGIAGLLDKYDIQIE
jgi:fluoroquinolone resistance protein